MSLDKNRFSFSTAAVLREEAASGRRKLPNIEMKLPRSYRYDEVLAGKCDSAEFAQALPQILSGERTDWRLWLVQIEVNWLSMTFEHDADLPTEPPQYCHLVVENPTVLGIIFTVPPVSNQPELTYECLMSSSGTGRSHSLQLTETYLDHATGRMMQNVLHLNKNLD